MDISKPISRLFDLALEEDGNDVTKELLFADKKKVSSKIVSKDEGVFCGIQVLESLKTHSGIDSVDAFVKDGSEIIKGQLVAELSGDVGAILALERIALNLIQRSSGIATETSKLVKLAAPYGVEVFDTRKNPAGYRAFDKFAFKCGGGKNHRMGLSQGVFLKENHFLYFGGFKKALAHFKEKEAAFGENSVIETRDLDEALLATDFGFKTVLIDNFKMDDAAEACQMIKERNPDTKIEYSGNVGLDNIADVCKTGVDQVSVGYITHSTKAFDFSMLAL